LTMGEVVEYIVAKYNYQAQEAQELSVRKNERLILVDDSRNWWKVRNSGNREGYVPSNFVRRVNWKDAIGGRFDVLKESLRRKNGTSESRRTSTSLTYPNSVKTFSLNGGDQSPALNSAAKSTMPSPSSAFVCFDYQPQREDEIELRKGDQIEVLEKSSDGWWRGQCSDRVGWFPSNYVTERRLRNLHLNDNFDFTRLDNNNKNSNGAIQSSLGCLASPSAARRRLEASRNCAVANGSACRLFGNRQWYFGKMTREQSEKLLDEYGSDGDYLIRDSETNPGDLSISMKAPVKNKHFWIQVDSNGFRIGNRLFSTIDELISHYMIKPISSNGRGGDLHLVKSLLTVVEP
ncbi:Cytoplasmic protein NCK2, partial [Trichinella zimbabwensis]